MKNKEFLDELNELLKKYDVKQMWGWDSGEVIITFEDNKSVNISYNYSDVKEKIGKLEVWDESN